MIILDKRSLKARLFLLCLRNPLARGSVNLGGGRTQKRPPAWYVENGTTLCHFFWVCFWVPLLSIAIGAGFLLIFVAPHAASYTSCHCGLPGAFIPELFVLGVSALAGIVILLIIGAGKTGLLAYLKALKQRICPRMAFK